MTAEIDGVAFSSLLILAADIPDNAVIATM